MSQKLPPDKDTFEHMVESLNAISGEPRSSTLISHLYLEYLLDWILRKKLPKPEKIIKRTFSSKLELVESMAILPDILMKHLWMINDIRNLYAHRIDTNSEEFDKEFRIKVEKTEWYQDMNKPEKILTPSAYTLVMVRVYHNLYGEFERM